MVRAPSDDVERVVAAEQDLIGADRVERRRPGDERPDDEHGEAGRERGERRPELTSELAYLRSVGHDRPDGEECENVCAEQHRELRASGVGEDDRSEHSELPRRRWTLESEHDRPERDRVGEVRRALRHHERDVHRGGDGDRERRDSDAPPRTQQAPRDEVDRERRQGEQKPVRRPCTGGTPSRGRRRRPGRSRGSRGRPGRARTARRAAAGRHPRPETRRRLRRCARPDARAESRRAARRRRRRLRDADHDCGERENRPRSEVMRPPMLDDVERDVRRRR